jgi:hypothetical protein
VARDWFADNAPKPSPSPEEDWFAANAPKDTAGVRSARGGGGSLKGQLSPKEQAAADALDEPLGGSFELPPPPPVSPGSQLPLIMGATAYPPQVRRMLIDALPTALSLAGSEAGLPGAAAGAAAGHALAGFAHRAYDEPFDPSMLGFGKDVLWQTLLGAPEAVVKAAGKGLGVVSRNKILDYLANQTAVIRRGHQLAADAAEATIPARLATQEAAAASAAEKSQAATAARREAAATTRANVTAAAEQPGSEVTVGHIRDQIAENISARTGQPLTARAKADLAANVRSRIKDVMADQQMGTFNANRTVFPVDDAHLIRQAFTNSNKARWSAVARGGNPPPTLDSEIEHALDPLIEARAPGFKESNAVTSKAIQEEQAARAAARTAKNRAGQAPAREAQRVSTMRSSIPTEADTRQMISNRLAGRPEEGPNLGMILRMRGGVSPVLRENLGDLPGWAARRASKPGVGAFFRYTPRALQVAAILAQQDEE